MIYFVGLENCVKWHKDTCPSVQNIPKMTNPFGKADNAQMKNRCIFRKNEKRFRGNIQNEDKCIAFVLV